VITKFLFDPTMDWTQHDSYLNPQCNFISYATVSVVIIISDSCRVQLSHKLQELKFSLLLYQPHLKSNVHFNHGVKFCIKHMMSLSCITHHHQYVMYIFAL